MELYSSETNDIQSWKLRLCIPYRPINRLRIRAAIIYSIEIKKKINQSSRQRCWQNNENKNNTGSNRLTPTRYGLF